MKFNTKTFGFSLLEVVLAVGILGVSFPILISLSAKSIENNRSTIHNLETQNAYNSIQTYIRQNGGLLPQFDSITSKTLYFYRNENSHWQFSYAHCGSHGGFVLEEQQKVDQSSCILPIYTYNLYKCTPDGNLFKNSIIKEIKICKIE